MKMKRRSTRTQQKQINILHTNTRQRTSRAQVTHIGFWAAIVLAMMAVVGVALHFGVGILLDHALYHNPRYVLKKIEIVPGMGHFSKYPICQATGLAAGENMWSLNLPQITRDLEKLAYVSSAQVERHFPDRLVIRIHERTPVVKIVGIDVDLGRRQAFYLDRDCIVLLPRRDEPAPVTPLPEIIGLTNAELEPGVRLDEPSLVTALQILNAINHTSTLNTAIDIKSIDLSQPLSIKMVTTRDLAITFRTDCVDQQLTRLVSIFERYGNDQQHTLKTVDLTPDQYDPITFYE